MPWRSSSNNKTQTKVQAVWCKRLPKHWWPERSRVKAYPFPEGSTAYVHLKPRQCIKNHRHHFASKGLSSQSCGFSSSHVQMWELDHKNGWAPKNRCFWTVVLEKTLESPLDSKEIQAVNPKGNQPWIFIGRTDVKAEAPTLWSPDMKSWLIERDRDAGKDWGQEEKGTTEDEMVGWHHQLNGQELEQIPEDNEGQESLGCCSPWGHKESAMT